MATYEITYRHCDEVSYSHGLTASQARYRHWGQVGDCFDSFKDFLCTIKSVRKVPHVAGAYDFITRQYGTAFNVGDIVTITGEGSATGKVGEVIHPNGQGAYVSVLLDGDTCLFHPMSLIVNNSEGDFGMSDNANLLRVASTFPMDPRHRQLLIDSADEIDSLEALLGFFREGGKTMDELLSDLKEASE